jgi:hypothetical protein
VLFVVGTALLPATARSGPFVANQDSSLTKKYREAEAAVLVKRVAVQEPTGPGDLGSTTYEIVQVPRSADQSLTKGMRITVPEKRADDQSGIVLLLGKRADNDQLKWTIPEGINSRRYNYLTHAPGSDADETTKLLYYVGRLEDADHVVATDAFMQVESAGHRLLVEIAEKLPRDSLREWLTDSELPVQRLGLYALMLGLCGDENDAEMMSEIVAEDVQDIRVGIEGVMSGLLWLSGTTGLDQIDEKAIKNKKCVFSETYAAMLALRFMWTYGKGRIPPDRLKQSLRLLLDRPEVSDLAIADLTRWKDWSVQGRVRDLYGVGEYNIPAVKRAIVRYMIASTKDAPELGGEQPAKHSADGKRYLDELRNLDSKTVNEVERHFTLP